MKTIRHKRRKFVEVDLLNSVVRDDVSTVVQVDAVVAVKVVDAVQ